MKRSLLTGLLATLLSFCGYAQKSVIATQTLSISLADVIDIRFENGQAAGPQLRMNFANAEDFYKGVESPLQKLKVRSNKDFTVSVRATTSSAASNNSSFVYLKVPENKTGGRLASNFSNNSYQPLTDNNLILLNDGQKGDDQTFSVQYKAKPGTTIDPGTYLVDVIFTATRY